MTHKYAVIDIGSNSVRLMFSDVSDNYSMTNSEKMVITTRLGEKVQVSHVLSDDAITRTMQAIENFAALIKNAQVDEVFAYATHAVRNAQNQNGFISLCEEKLQTNVQILSEEQEARMSFLGVTKGTSKGRVIDIGGGSTEMIAGDGQQISVVGSVGMGAVNASEMFPDNAPGHIAVRNAFRSCQASMIEYKKNGEKIQSSKNGKALMNRMRKEEGAVYIVGGTGTTLSALGAGLRQSYEPKIVNGRMVTHGEIRRVMYEIAPMPISHRQKILLLKDRADVFCFGVSILLTCMDELGVQHVTSSDQDGLEGYLHYQLAEKAKGGIDIAK